jgi:hypothetical protein
MFPALPAGASTGAFGGQLSPRYGMDGWADGMIHGMGGAMEPALGGIIHGPCGDYICCACIQGQLR